MNAVKRLLERDPRPSGTAEILAMKILISLAGGKALNRRQAPGSENFAGVRIFDDLSYRIR